MPEYVVCEEEKEEWEELSHACNYLAAIWGASSVVIGGVGVVAGGGFWILGEMAGDVAEDPPKLNFRRAVKLGKIAVKIPTIRNKRFKSLGNIIKLTRKSAPAAKALLDSMEFYRGAKKAKDEKYTRMHLKTALQMTKKVHDSLKNVVPSLRNVANKIKGTEYDVKLSHKLWKQEQNKVRRKGFSPQAKLALKKAGFNDSDIKRFQKSFANAFRKKIPPTNLSYLLKIGGNMIERAEKKLGKSYHVRLYYLKKNKWKNA
ncbi:hypothetical protein HZB05_01575 [Candidatus Wolfebacteria bacterium]|nr:hypothetical protein [Candidatus Wolfebacteria bacterium]